VIKKDLLLTPGPTTVPAKILLSMAEPLFHHRTPQYQKLFSEVCEGLKFVFRTKHDVLTLTSSGTGAMESAMVNLLSAGDQVIVVDAGKFGERFGDIGKAFGIQCDIIKIPYGKAVDPQVVGDKLKSGNYKAVFTTLCETSTGVVHDIQGLAKVVCNSSAVLICDAISGLGADRLEMDEWGVDVVVSGSQKGLMLPPGLAFIALNDKAWKLTETSELPKFYYNLAQYKKALKKGDTPWTPATTLVVGLNEALKTMHAEGYDEVIDRHARLAESTRAAMTAIGLELFAERPSNAVTSIKVPTGIDGVKLVKVIRDELGITLAGGQGDMKGQIFRFGHLGYCSEYDLVSGVAAVEQVLDRLGYKFKLGDGLTAFQKVIRSRQKLSV